MRQQGYQATADNVLATGLAAVRTATRPWAAAQALAPFALSRIE